MREVFEHLEKRLGLGPRLFFLMILMVLGLGFWGCNKALISESDLGLIKPRVKSKRSLEIFELINQSGNRSFDVLERVIAEFLLEELRDLKRIRTREESLALDNKKEVLESVERFQEQDMEELKDQLLGLNESSKKLFKGLDLEEEVVEEEVGVFWKDIERGNERLMGKEEERERLKWYWEYYQKNATRMESYLGIDLEEDRGVLFRTFEVQVGKEVIVSRIRDILNPEYLELQVGDFKVLGVIKEDLESGKRARIDLRVYDQEMRRYIIEKEIIIELGIKLGSEIKKISRELKGELNQYPKGVLVVESEPEGAGVYLDKRKIGETGLKGERRIGFYNLEVLKEGYNKFKKEIYISEGGVLEEKVELKKRGEEKGGEVWIESEPVGADIFIDLSYYGKTPMSLKDLEVGDYKVRLEKEGYEYSYGKLEVEEGRSKVLSFEMREGETGYIDVEEFSKDFNVVKNIFFYGTFVSLGTVLYAFLQADKYRDRANIIGGRYFGQGEQGLMDLKKYREANSLKNMTIGVAVGCIVLAIIFQILELNAEDIEVGLTPWGIEGGGNGGSKDSEEVEEEDLAGKISIRLKF